MYNISCKKRHSGVVAASIFAVSMLIASPLAAQPVPSKDGSSTHIFPAGGRRGTTVAVRVGTECMPPQTEVHVWGTGVTATPRLVKESRGGTEPSPRRKPTEIPINYPREWEATFDIAAEAPPGVTFWRLSCASGGTTARPFIVGDLPEYIEAESNSSPNRAEAVSLPVTINGRIAGERDADYFRFHANAGQAVRCEVVARRIGSPLDPVVWFYGPTGERLDAQEFYLGSDPVLSFPAAKSGEYRVRVANVGGAGGLKYVYRLTLESTAASTSDAGEDPAASSATAAHFTPATALPLILPVTRTDLFTPTSAENWYEFDAKKEQRFSLSFEALPGSTALPVAELIDVGGRQLARRSVVESVNGRVAFEWTAPADGKYRIRLRDAQGRKRPDTAPAYRMSVTAALPDYALSLKSDITNVVQGDSASVEVVADRRGGFTGSIELSVEGMPSGVSVIPATIAEGQSIGTLKLTAEDATPSGGTALHIVGRATIGDESIVRLANASHAGVDSEGTSVGSPTIDHLFLTVRHKPLFRLFCNEAYQYAHRGTIYPYAMEVERLNAFTGEISVQQGDRQNRDLDGVEMLDLRIPPERAQGDVPIYFPETMHINIQSQTQLYTQGYALFDDERGRPQAFMVVSEKRNLLRTMPTVARLTAADPIVTARPGDKITCRLNVHRTVNCPGALSIELVDAPEIVVPTAKMIELSAGATEVVVPLQIEAGAAHSAESTLRFRASGGLQRGATFVSEARVILRIESSGRALR